MWIGLFTVRAMRGEGARARAACVCPGCGRAGASHAARLSAFQHASRLRPPRSRHPPLPSWDHMFLCNGFCCSPPLSYCFLFKKFTLQLFYFTCFSDIISLVSPRRMKSSPVMQSIECSTLHIMKYWWSETTYSCHHKMRTTKGSLSLMDCE